MNIEQKPKSPRPPRILWTSAYCLLDTSSGASMSIYQMLKELKAIGYEVAIVGATTFDSENGKLRLKQHWDTIQKNEDRIIKIDDAGFLHHLAVTEKTARALMTAEEIGNWYNVYVSVLETFKPDLVFFYGGHPMDMLIPDEARIRGIPSAAYLVNENYTGARWCRDVDIIITDTQATADFYKRKNHYNLTPVGKFIDPKKVISETNSRQRLLFINPSPQKGSAIVAQLAMVLEKERPDITFEVVESRGNWSETVSEVLKASDGSVASLSNVIVTPNTDDMRDVYSRARALLAPSLWWESGARVLAEAMLNGIPAIVTVNGGNQEMIHNAGIHIRLPAICHQKPYDHLPNEELLRPLIEKIIKLYDDEEYYKTLVTRAYKVGHQFHDIKRSTKRLVSALTPLVSRLAGDNDFRTLETTQHKHALYETFPGARESVIHEPLEDNQRGLFIDCGGYDGCSAVKFLTKNPNFDSITFEPNPSLWKYYQHVPTSLIKKAVFTYNGQVTFRIDSVDADGSSVIGSKQVDYWGRVDNAACPSIEVDCIDLCELIRNAKDTYQKIVLKLDIEGAEYDVLEKLLKEDLVTKIDKLYCEFHWQKCGFPRERHLDLVKRLEKLTSVVEWDALDSAIHNQPDSLRLKREDRMVKLFGENLALKQTPPKFLLQGVEVK